MRDEIQKRPPVLLPHRRNRHRISLHCIRETEAVPSNSKEKTCPFTKKWSRTPYDQTDVFRPSRVLRSFFRRIAGNETDVRFPGAFFRPHWGNKHDFHYRC